METLSVTPEPAELRSFTPFATLDEGQLILLASRVEPLGAAEGERIFSIGDPVEGWVFLLRGVVELEAADGTRRVVEGGGERARDPLNPGQTCPHGAIALDPCTLLRVDPGLIGALQFSAADTAIDDDAHPVIREIREDLRRNHFSLPSLPEIALRIRKAIEGNSASVGQIAKIVSADPVITAKLIKAANSAFYHGRDPIETCQAAIVRLGLNTTKQLVTSFALRELFSLKDPALKKRMQQTWRHSTEIGAISMMLAQLDGRLEPEQALLAGLVHDIGVVSLLSHVHRHPDIAADDKALGALILALRGEVGGMVLRHWKFSDAIVEAAIHARDWRRDSGPELDYCDLVIIAQLHSLMKAGKSARHPPLDEIPACRKLPPEVLTPTASLDILDRANGQIGEILRMLS